MSMAKAAVFVLRLLLSATAFAQQPAQPQQAGLAPLAMRWAKFVDPVEHAFSIDVPVGWRVAGGIKRMSTVDIRSGVDTTRPYHFIDNSGAIHNSNSATAPAGSNWHPLPQVPAG